MSQSLVEITRVGPVFVLRMCAAENLVNLPFLAAMNAALDEVLASDGEAALVITGEGKHYSTGFDRSALADPDAAADIVEGAVRLCGRLLALPVPSCAAMNGHAFGIGGMIALCHDFRVMRRDRGFFCLPELALGLPLHPGMYALLKLRVDRVLLNEMLLTGVRVAAERALAYRVIDEALPEAEVLPRAIERAQALAPHRGALLESYKRNLNASALAVIEGGTSFRFPPISG